MEKAGRSSWYKLTGNQMQNKLSLPSRRPTIRQNVIAEDVEGEKNDESHQINKDGLQRVEG